MIDLFIPCIPPKTSHHHKKVFVKYGRDGVAHAAQADRPELNQARGDWLTMLMPHAPLAPLGPPIALLLEFTWPWRASDSKRARLLGRIPCTVKPDADNMAKTLTDVLVMAGFLAHDAEVTDLTVRKWIGNRPGLRLVMATLELGTGAVPTLAAPLFEGASS